VLYIWRTDFRYTLLKTGKNIICVLITKVTCPYCGKRNRVESPFDGVLGHRGGIGDYDDIEAIKCCNCKRSFVLDDFYENCEDSLLVEGEHCDEK